MIERITRRHFLRLAGFSFVGLALAGCGQEEGEGRGAEPGEMGSEGPTKLELFKVETRGDENLGNLEIREKPDGELARVLLEKPFFSPVQPDYYLRETRGCGGSNRFQIHGNMEYSGERRIWYGQDFYSCGGNEVFAPMGGEMKVGYDPSGCFVDIKNGKWIIRIHHLVNASDLHEVKAGQLIAFVDPEMAHIHTIAAYGDPAKPKEWQIVPLSECVRTPPVGLYCVEGFNDRFCLPESDLEKVIEILSFSKDHAKEVKEENREEQKDYFLEVKEATKPPELKGKAEMVTVEMVERANSTVILDFKKPEPLLVKYYLGGFGLIDPPDRVWETMAIVERMTGVDKFLLLSLFHSETPSFSCELVSPVGAKGPFQFMPSTFNQVVEYRLREQIFDLTVSTLAAAVYIKKMGLDQEFKSAMVAKEQNDEENYKLHERRFIEIFMGKRGTGCWNQHRGQAIYVFNTAEEFWKRAKAKRAVIIELD